MGNIAYESSHSDFVMQPCVAPAFLAYCKIGI